MTQVENKTVLITGGANGIGLSSARELLRQGAKVVIILDLAESNGEAVAAELKNEFGEDRVIFVPSDVSNHDKFKESFAQVVQSVGKLDILINNAGVMNDAEWEAQVDVNYKGVVSGTILSLNHMGKHKGGDGGTVLNVASIAGLSPIPLAPIYGGTHHAIVGFSTALRYFYDKTGVRVMTLCPGLTATSLASKFMSSKDYSMDIVDDQFAAENMVQYEEQSAEHVANAVIETIEKGSCGTIVVSENNQSPYVVEIPSYDTWKVPL